MSMKRNLIALALATVVSGSVAAASMTSAQAHAVLEGRGLTEIGELSYVDGQWQTWARNTEGVLVDVRLNPADSQVTFTPRTTITTTTTTTRPATPTATEEKVVVQRVIEQPVVKTPIMVEERVLVPVGGKISKDVVRAVLADAGYSDIHDIDWLSHRGVWKAEADDPYGDDREVHVDPLDARIVHVEED